VTIVLDDHLLRDLLADDASAELKKVLRRHDPSTTNLYYLRLCKSVVSARGSRLVGGWPTEQRVELGRALMALPSSVRVVPLRDLAYRMAELGNAFRVSSLGAEAAAAAEHLDATLCVWDGEDGPGIREAVTSIGGTYRTIAR
jgi:hypothetical protein